MFNKLFLNKKPLIGMIHLPALPGYENHPGMKSVINKALVDLETLQKAGYDGALVENDNDQPHQIKVLPAVKMAFGKVVTKILKQASIPVGMEIIYDMTATIKVAQEVGAQFVRLDVFVDNVETKWGKIPAQVEELIKLKKKINAEKLVLLTDIQVKHAKMLDRKSLEKSAKEAIKYGTDALVVTGNWTGEPPSLYDCKTAKKVAKETPVFIGSGLNKDNVKALFKYADGAVVGTSIKTGDYVNFKKAKELMEVVNEIRSNL